MNRDTHYEIDQKSDATQWPAEPVDKTVARRLRKLYQRELAACEVYADTPNLFDDAERCGVIAAIEHEHRQRLDALGALIDEHGLERPEGSGKLGSLARFVEGGVEVIGPKLTLKMLRQGEAHLRKLYRRALDDGLPPRARTWVHDSALPAAQRAMRQLGELTEPG